MCFCCILNKNHISSLFCRCFKAKTKFCFARKCLFQSQKQQKEVNDASGLKFLFVLIIAVTPAYYFVAMAPSSVWGRSFFLTSVASELVFFITPGFPNCVSVLPSILWFSSLFLCAFLPPVHICPSPWCTFHSTPSSSPLPSLWPRGAQALWP